MEHARWMIERLNDGWVHGSKKDTKNKISPYLLPWERLPKDTKEYDIKAVESFPDVLTAAGYEIFRIK